jgi:hypothetical protein
MGKPPHAARYGSAPEALGVLGSDSNRTVVFRFCAETAESVCGCEWQELQQIRAAIAGYLHRWRNKCLQLLVRHRLIAAGVGQAGAVVRGEAFDVLQHHGWYAGRR